MRSIRTAVCAAGFAFLATQAWAHAFLKTSEPAVGSTVSKAPTQVVINYTEGVEPLFSSIVVKNAQGEAVQVGKPRLEHGDTHLAVALKPLPRGTYTVIWHATAVDTHKTQGSFRFTVGHG